MTRRAGAGGRATRLRAPAWLASSRAAIPLPSVSRVMEELVIDGITRASVKKLTDEFWLKQVETPAFQALFAGKEIGHRIADYVDERTTAMLEAAFETMREQDARGRIRPRSMGDVWIKSGGVYNPVNVKAGEAGKNGQPNMVSLTKLLDGLLLREIDSYDLLIVKMRLEGHAASEDVLELELRPGTIVPNVYFVDMLDYLDFITFDSGPGQAMLREKQFYEAVDGGFVPPVLTMAEKVSRLVDLIEDGDRRLFENRAKKMARLRDAFEAYKQTDGHAVSQGGVTLG